MLAYTKYSCTETDLNTGLAGFYLFDSQSCCSPKHASIHCHKEALLSLHRRWFYNLSWIIFGLSPHKNEKQVQYQSEYFNSLFLLLLLLFWFCMLDHISFLELHKLCVGKWLNIDEVVCRRLPSNIGLRGSRSIFENTGSGELLWG